MIDPEGDYDALPRAIALRSSDAKALADDVMSVLEHPAQNAVVNLMDLRLADQPSFLQRLLPRLLTLRTATGRPHWILIDEAHHLLPAAMRKRIWWPSTMSEVAECESQTFFISRQE